MLVRITPPGRRARFFNVSGVERSWDIQGGCATASVPIVLTAEDAERILLAKVETFGASGMDWAGVVWRRPRYGQPLECAGQAIGLTHQRGTAMYADRSLDVWQEATIDSRSHNIETQTDTAGITLALRGGTAYGAGEANYRFRRMDARDHPRVTFSFNKNGLSGTRLELWAGIAGTGNEGINWGATYEWNDTSGTSGTAVVDISIHNVIALAFRLYVVTPGTPANNTPVTITNLCVYGEGLTSVTATGVINHCLDKLPAHVLPAGVAYRRNIATTTDTLGSFFFADPRDDLKKRIDTAVATTDHHFGFYPGRVGNLSLGLPYFQQIPTTPNVFIDLSRAVSDDLRELAADSLASDHLVGYTDANGRTVYTSVDDPNPTRYLNRIGYERTGYIDASWTTSSATAALAATVAANQAERGAEGGVVIGRAWLMNGREIPVTMLRPGMLARTRGSDTGTRDMVIRNCQAVDSHEMKVGFGTPLDLKHLTARASRP